MYGSALGAAVIQAMNMTNKGQFTKGHPGYNGSENGRWTGGDKPMVCAECGEEFFVHKYLNPKFCSRDCHFKNLGKTQQGPNANGWKGDEAGYKAKHAWINYHYGSPRLCEKCGTMKTGVYHWSNNSGKYLRDRRDWERLCVSCHNKKDGRITNITANP